MKLRIMLSLVALGCLPNLLFAVSAFYCSERHGYINVGMTEEQVINACGEPLSRQKSTQPLTIQVPLTQLIYDNEGAPRAFYGVWALPIGNSNPNNPPFGGNAGGIQMQVDIIKDKVANIKLNGSSTNAFSICNGRMIKVGAPARQVYNACGNPSLVNKSYINQPIPSKNPPEIWVYQADQYQPPVSLTFLDGKLQSIE